MIDCLETTTVVIGRLVEALVSQEQLDEERKRECRHHEVFKFVPSPCSAFVAVDVRISQLVEFLSPHSVYRPRSLSSFVSRIKVDTWSVSDHLVDSNARVRAEQIPDPIG